MLRNDISPWVFGTNHWSRYHLQDDHGYDYPFHLHYNEPHSDGVIARFDHVTVWRRGGTMRLDREGISCLETM